MAQLSDPIVVKEFRKSFLFGLIKIEYLIEDRRPDLEVYEGKYKYYICLHIFGCYYGWVIRSNNCYDDQPYR